MLGQELESLFLNYSERLCLAGSEVLPVKPTEME